MTKNLWYDPLYHRRPVKTKLNWNITGTKLREQQTGFPNELTYEDEIELCHGCGSCRGLTAGRMCPVFKAYHGEVDSCRGRLNVLRWLLKADGLPSEFVQSNEYQRIIYDHCVQCKMCLIECPSNVNVSKLIAEARAQYSAQRGVPDGYRYFTDVDRYGDLGSRLAPLSNLLFRNGIFRRFLELTTGIDRSCCFPPFSQTTFAECFRDSQPTLAAASGKSIIFFYDTFINYNRPDIGLLIVKILERNSYRVLVPPQKSSGLTTLIERSSDQGRRLVEYNIASLAPYAEKEIPIMTFSPSSGVALKMEHLSVLDTPASRAVAESTFDIHEFLYQLHRRSDPGRRLSED